MAFSAPSALRPQSDSILTNEQQPHSIDRLALMAPRPAYSLGTYWIANMLAWVVESIILLCLAVLVNSCPMQKEHGYGVTPRAGCLRYR